jgi:ribonuclease-3
MPRSWCGDCMTRVIEVARQCSRSVLEFKQRFGLEEADTQLLTQALTHPSFVFENLKRGWEHNQRLEFLGDAVLGLVVADHLYRCYPDQPEGELTKMRSAVVCEPTLARKSLELELGQYLRLGRGEEMSGGRERPSILADAFEAVTGALYLSLGLEAVRVFILGHLAGEIEQVAAGGQYVDYKTTLQELIQKQSDDVVQYTILAESGPDHNKSFVAGVILNDQLVGKGTGKTKKEAEQHAARAALDRLNAGSAAARNDG